MAGGVEEAREGRTMEQSVPVGLCVSTTVVSRTRLTTGTLGLTIELV